MYQFHCMNAISSVGLEGFDENYTETKEINEADALLVRSAALHDTAFGDKLLAIGRAGAGVNNIPLERCAQEGIVVFNTPGANANAVKEIVVAGLMLASRDIIGGANWILDNKDDVNIGKSAEKAKKAFAGQEVYGKKLGVIGLGAIGVRVANTATNLGMDVYGYDPYLSVDAAWSLSRSIIHAKNVEELYRNCDYITIHVPAMESTKGMINKEAISMMKEGVIILNFARDSLVNEKDVIEALENGHVKKYVTDFATPGIVGVKNTVVLPHLGASTEESEDNCAVMAVKEIRDYLENGNIRNSVNYPNCNMGIKADDVTRIAVLHKNVPNIIGQISSLLANDGVNIEDMTNKSRGAFAYTLLDIVVDKVDHIVDDLKKNENIIRVRVIR